MAFVKKDGYPEREFWISEDIESKVRDIESFLEKNGHTTSPNLICEGAVSILTLQENLYGSQASDIDNESKLRVKLPYSLFLNMGSGESLSVILLTAIKYMKTKNIADWTHVASAASDSHGMIDAIE
ncbi:hypothetical protein SARC_14323, partial [Sphaeroforma arctica JP610]